MKKVLIVCIVIMLLTGCGTDNTPVNTNTPTTTPTVTPLATSPSAPQDETIEDIAVSYVTDLAKGDFNKVLTTYSYDATMKNALTEALLKDQIWGYLITTYGQFKEITGTIASQADGFDIISVKTSFENAKLYINVVFDGDKRIAGLNHTPDPDTTAKPIPEGITETPITFGKSGWELPGTLTTPKGTGPYPVLILVHGSGPNDRDETIGPNKPFRDIAWNLAEKGIATLRYDKRTFVYQKEMAALTDGTVYEETVEDAALALQFLQSNSSIDKNRIYILGHSLGGMLIPQIAELTADATGYIILAGSVTPLEDIIVDQINYLCELDGTVSNDEKQAIQSYETMRDNVKALTPNSDAKPESTFGVPAAYWLDLKDYNSAELAKKIEKPLLILQGERDYQVPMSEFTLWKDALGSKTNVTMKSYPGLDHLFLYGTEKSDPQEYNVPGEFDRNVIEDIANWILN